MNNKLEKLRQEIDLQLKYALRPGGKIDLETREQLGKMLNARVLLQNRLRVSLSLGSWLTAAVTAYGAGWRPARSTSLLDTMVDTDDARQLALMLARVDLGPKWVPVIKAVQLVALAGEFQVTTEPVGV